MKTFLVYNLDTGLPVAIGEALKAEWARVEAGGGDKYSRRKSNRRGNQLGKEVRTSVNSKWDQLALLP